MISSYIDLRLAERLKSIEFRREWFRAALETDVPKLFRTLRERRELTQSELATLANMKQSAISRFEGSSDANWKFETLLAQAEAMDARLFIGLEASEDAIARVEREERHTATGQSAIAASSPIAENLNSSDLSRQNLAAGINLPALGKQIETDKKNAGTAYGTYRN